MPSNGVRFVVHDACDASSLRDEFETIVSFETVEHVAEPAGFTAQLIKLLDKGGRLIISSPNSGFLHPESHEPLNPFHIHEFTLEEFEEFLSSRFVEVSFYLQIWKPDLEETGESGPPAKDMSSWLRP